MFGDCGKGVTTDSLAIRAPKNSVNVRFSGGQQCGHTVYIDEKTNHVFSNFGSASFRGLPTYFTEHCLVYPKTMYEEYLTLLQLDVNPKVVIHPLAKLTTNIDVAWNRALGSFKTNGTVGLGIGATMTRHNTSGHKLYAFDLLNMEMLAHKLHNIRNYYVQMAIRTLRQEDYIAFLHECDNTTSVFLETCFKMGKYLQIQGYDYLNQFDLGIFEGSQGVLLDMDHGIFPNVTYANTTAKNAEEVLNLLGVGKHHRQYFLLTRAYTHRHGAGWMPHEQSEVTLVNDEMEINQCCPWQGEPRSSPFCLNTVKTAIEIVKLYSNISIFNTNIILGFLDRVTLEEQNRVIKECEDLEYRVQHRWTHISELLYLK